MAYKIFAKDYHIYIFSRKNKFNLGDSAKDMAKDPVAAMRALGIGKASVMGVSQGGMIAQHIAIDYPELVEKLVWAVTVSRQNDAVQNVVGRWIEMAEPNDYKGIFTDTAEKSYSEKYLRKYRPLYPILSRMGRPKEWDRFIIQANACICRDAYGALETVRCPTLVIGGDSDKVVGQSASDRNGRSNNGQRIDTIQRSRPCSICRGKGF